METFDLRESIIPFSLLQICNRFKRMRPGEVIEIITRDAGVADDLERILPVAVRETLLQQCPCESGIEFRIQLKKLSNPKF